MVLKKVTLSDCDHVLYNKKSLFGLPPQSLTRGSWSPCEFLSDKSTRSIFCSNEATPAGLMDAGWSSEKPGHDNELGIFSPTSHFFREGKRAGNGVYWSCLREEASRNPSSMGFESFPVGEHIYIPGGWQAPNPPGRGSCIWDPPRPLPMYLFIWLFTCILLSCPLISKRQTYMFPEFCEPF